ncbi:MAG: DNA-processing protein DprA, partial [Hyphomicrobiaceae bacterium]
VAEGCVIAEQPMGFQARAQDFPRRNRVISGVSRAIVVVEAARRSGSLITARLAGEQGREVFAVPGHPLDPRAEGTNQLIKDGATMATSADDVLRALGDQDMPRTIRFDDAPLDGSGLGDIGETSAPSSSTAPEVLVSDAVLAAVRSVLGPAPVNIDEIARATGLSIRAVQIAVMELSLACVIEFHGHQLVSLRTGRE